jgi:hypothetical protein
VSDNLHTIHALRHVSEQLRELSKRQQRLLDDWHRLESIQQFNEAKAIKEEFDNAITSIVNWPVWMQENGLIPLEGESDDDR